MEKLVSAIKRKDGKQSVRLKLKKVKERSNIRVKTAQCDKEIKEYEELEDLKEKTPELKEPVMKKFLKKKSSLGMSPSPKK